MATTANTQVRLSASRAIASLINSPLSTLHSPLSAMIGAVAGSASLVACALGYDFFMYLCAFVFLGALNSALSKFPSQDKKGGNA